MEPPRECKRWWWWLEEDASKRDSAAVFRTAMSGKVAICVGAGVAILPRVAVAATAVGLAVSMVGVAWSASMVGGRA